MQFLDVIKLLIAGPHEAELSKTLDAATVSATGVVAVTADLSKTLGSLTVSATAVVAVAGDASSVLAAATMSATAAVEVKGQMAATLDAATMAAILYQIPGFNLNVALDSLELDAEAAVAVYGAVDSVLDELEISGRVRTRVPLDATFPVPCGLPPRCTTVKPQYRRSA